MAARGVVVAPFYNSQWLQNSLGECETQVSFMWYSKWKYSLPLLLKPFYFSWTNKRFTRSESKSKEQHDLWLGHSPGKRKNLLLVPVPRAVYAFYIKQVLAKMHASSGN